MAIKVPHKQSAELYKLLKEPRLQAALSHPNIVRMLAAEKEKNVFFMVMEYVKGPTLEKILEKERVLGTEQALDFVRQICYGVDHAHKAKIIHRDLRPSNIIVSEDGTAKITDFGTSAWLNAVPYASTRIGSPPYMAPEQFMGKASYASDLYSLGCIFYEMVIGRPPIFDPDPFKILEMAQQGKITPPRIKNGRVPRGGRRHHHEGPGPQGRGPLPDAPRRSSATCPSTRAGRPRPRRSTTSCSGSRPGSRRRPPSAATAGGPCRPGRRNCPHCGETDLHQASIPLEAIDFGRGR
ncbi:MAG: protein kinase [Candidatus Moduliflexus flocculans]|nr:protein kinase [Candidatus Moduliflexus flocculans]